MGVSTEEKQVPQHSSATYRVIQRLVLPREAESDSLALYLEMGLALEQVRHFIFI